MLAAVYCRVSTEKDDQINSLESQRSYFLHYIEKCPELELFQIYADRGISGTGTKNRSQFMRMISDAEKGLFRVIITKEVSRFSRNILDAVSYSRKLKSWGVTIRFVNDGIDTSQSDAELRLSIMASLAQEESRKTSSRVKWGQTRRMEAGIVFGTSMLGYDVKNGKLRINPEGAETVRKIFEKYVSEHLSASEIAAELEKEGIKTYTGRTEWNPSVIMKILKNEKYCGDLKQKKTYTPDYLTHKKAVNRNNEKFVFIKNHHPAIIPGKLWEEAQKEISRKGSGRISALGKGTKYPLSGKIICGSCGSAFAARKRNGKNGVYLVWKCPSAANRDKGNRCNVKYQIRNDSALYMAERCLSLLINRREKTAAAVFSLILKARERLTGDLSCSARQLNEDIDALTAKRLKMTDEYLSGKISENDFYALKQKYECMLLNYRSELQKIKEKNPSRGFISAQTEEFIKKLICEGNFPERTAADCVESITACPNGTVKVKLRFVTEVFEFKYR